MLVGLINGAEGKAAPLTCPVTGPAVLDARKYPATGRSSGILLPLAVCLARDLLDFYLIRWGGDVYSGFELS